MSSHTPYDNVQDELAALSPLLAQLRAQKATDLHASTDMDTLHELGEAALAAVPIQEQESETVVATPTMSVVHRKRNWLGLVAAAVAMMLGALVSYSVYTNSEVPDNAFAGTNEALIEELIASYEEQTTDPMAFLLDDELLFAEEDDLFFSPAEDVLLDWAEDGTVDEALSEEVMLDALW